MTSLTIKRNHHWSDDWQPYLLTVNGLATSNLYDNKSISVDLPQGTHEICLQVAGCEKLKTKVEIKDKPLLLEIAVNNNFALVQYALVFLFLVLTLLNLNIRSELIVIGFGTLAWLALYFYQRKNAIRIRTI